MECKLPWGRAHLEEEVQFDGYLCSAIPKGATEIRALSPLTAPRARQKGFYTLSNGTKNNLGELVFKVYCRMLNLDEDYGYMRCPERENFKQTMRIP